MTCCEYEPLIALWVEGDLNDREVERHLAECSGCRELLEDLRSSQAALKELPVVDAAFLSAVRSGVLAKIERRRPMVWPWVAAFAVAGALIIAVLTAPQKPTPIAKSPVSGRATPPAAVARTTSVAKRRGRPRGRLRTKGSAPLVVKMLTDDPNIVIIWLVDQPGD
jgi:predicted anti-sigma-YlaC factor YlaD